MTRLDTMQARPVTRSDKLTKLADVAEQVAAQGETLDKFTDVLSNLTTKLNEVAEGMTTAPVAAPVAAPTTPVNPPIAQVQTLAANVGDVATTGAALPESKRKLIRKHADGDAENSISGVAMLKHYLSGTLPKHIGKVMPDDHIYRVIDGRGEYAPSPNGPKAAFANALIQQIESGQPLPDAVVTTVSAVGATEAERGDALRKVCDTRKYGERLVVAVLSQPGVHFGQNGAMLSMVANTARARCKAAGIAV